MDVTSDDGNVLVTARWDVGEACQQVNTHIVAEHTSGSTSWGSTTSTSSSADPDATGRESFPGVLGEGDMEVDAVPAMESATREGTAEDPIGVQELLCLEKSRL